MLPFLEIPLLYNINHTVANCLEIKITVYLLVYTMPQTLDKAFYPCIDLFNPFNNLTMGIW